MRESLTRPKEKLYEYQGKQFKCDPWTIKQLNYALALNGRKDRYVLVKKPKKIKNEDGN